MLDFTKSYESARGLAALVALSGGQRFDGLWEAPWVPSCDDPKEVVHVTPRTERDGPHMAARPIGVRMLVPCRRCERCLQIRQMQWRDRILAEMMARPYATFITLTFSPAHLAGVLAKAKSKGWEGQAGVERAAYSHVSAYWKRLRKGRKSTHRKGLSDSLGRRRQRFDPVDLRFFCAMEYGEEHGRLHFHAIAHTHRWVPDEIWNNEWRSRSSAELVRSREGCATYVSKYLTKDQTPGRARASLNYGH